MVKPHQRKDGRWYASIYIGKNIFNKNQYKYIYGKDFYDCQKNIIDFLYKKENNLITTIKDEQINIKDKTFIEAYEDYLNEKVKNNKIRVRTKEDYMGCVNKNLSDIKNIKIKNLNLEMFKIMIEKIKIKEGSKLVNRVFKVINPFMDKLSKTKKIEYNFLNEIMLPKITVKKHAKCDDSTLETIIELLKKEPNREYLYEIILIGACCGTRISETLAIDYYKSFDFEKKILKIYQQQVKEKGKGYIIEETTKSENGKRYIPLLDIFIKEIKILYEKQELYFKINNIQKDPNYSTLLLLNNKGKMITENTAHRHFKQFIDKYKDANNISSEITFHSFRRYFATWLMKNGISDKVAKEFMGHSNIEMTQYYQDDDMEFNLKEFNKAQLNINI